MYARSLIFLLVVCLISLQGYSQTYTYTYTDPCTGKTKSIEVPQNGVNVTYYGQIHMFQPNDFFNGVFEDWANNVYRSFGGNNPCATLTGLPQGISVAQGTAINFIGIITSITSSISMSSSGATSVLGGTVSDVQNSGGGSSGTDGGNGSSTTTTSDPGTGSTTTTSVTVSTTSDGTTTTSSTSSTSTTQNSDGSSTTTTTESSCSSPSAPGNGSPVRSKISISTTTKEEPKAPSSGSSQGDNSGNGQTNVMGGTTKSIGNSSGGSKNDANSKNGNRPNIVASGDFVGFNFKNSDVQFGSKLTGGYTSTSWDGKTSHGLMCDYTSALKGPNISGFYAWLGSKRVDLISTTLTMGFDSKFSAYGTVALGQMWTIKKLGKLKLLYMGTGSFGDVYGTKFIGTALIVGGTRDFKAGKRFDLNAMLLYVYVPYMSYYNDIVLKSPHVVLPMLGTNIKITKRFKFNISGGGAWAINQSTLNYTITLGSRFLL